jgi:hypothetical protein
MIGLKMENYASDAVRILVAFTSTLTTFAFNFQIQNVPIASNDLLYVTLFYIGSFGSSFALSYAIIAWIISTNYNKIKLSLFRKSACLYLLGDSNYVLNFVKDLQFQDKFKKTTFSMFRKSKIKVIIVIPPLQKNQYSIISKSINYAFVYADINENLFSSLVLKDTGQSTQIISLYENDDLNMKVLIGIAKMIEDLEVFYSKQIVKHTNASQKKLSRYKLKIDAYLPDNSYGHLDIFQIHQKLKNSIHFYCYNDIVSYNLVFNYPPYTKIKNQYVFIGFGHTNQSILKSLLINNVNVNVDCQYMVITNDIDKTKDEFFSRISFKDKSESYLELPYSYSIIKSIHFVDTDVFGHQLSHQLNQFLDGNSKVHIMIAIGDDISNIHATHVIIKNLKSFDHFYSASTFTRVKDNHLNSLKLIDQPTVKCHTFGSIDEVYNYKNIVGAEYADFAVKVHNSLYPDQLINWHDLTLYDKKSSLFAVLSIKNKLRSIGFDLVVSHENSAVEDYYNLYDPSGLRDLWKKVDSISEFERYLNNNDRNMIASREHERWNMFMIIEGFVPMEKSKFIDRLKQNIEKPTRDLVRNQHICITSYKGLFELAQILSQYNQDNQTNYNIDYIYYDFKMMDSIDKIIENSQYKIVKMID